MNNQNNYNRQGGRATAPRQSQNQYRRPPKRRPKVRPGIKTYDTPKKSADSRVLLALFGIIAAIIILILLLTPRSEDIPELEVQAFDATTEVTTTEAEPPPPTNPYADRTDATVTLTTEISCNNSILIDVTNNTVIAEKGGDERIYPASMTKVMTILVAAENCKNLEDTFEMTIDIIDPLYRENASVAGFSPGEQVSVLDMLYGAALPSGADATTGLAIYTAGSEEAFAELMNKKCEELLLENTHFVNASGLHDDNHYSTCHDIAIIMKAALANDTVRQILSTYQYTTAGTAQHPEGILLTDTMFSRIHGKDEFDGKIQVIGGKTGYTGEAGQCLVSAASVVANPENEYILVTAGGADKWKPIYDTIYMYRHFLGVEYEGEYVPKHLR